MAWRNFPTSSRLVHRVTAMPQSDGSQKAIGLHIFMESQKASLPIGISWIASRQHHDQRQR
jgi:hypothetical protein